MPLGESLQSQIDQGNVRHHYFFRSNYSALTFYISTGTRSTSIQSQTSSPRTAILLHSLNVMILDTTPLLYLLSTPCTCLVLPMPISFAQRKYFHLISCHCFHAARQSIEIPCFVSDNHSVMLPRFSIVIINVRESD
jgi:hypothetical protein